MSIQSEINRISGNISNSLDAVAAKGVTVPVGSTSDDLAGLIELITGSSGENGDVYQDENGYLVLSDEPGTNVTVTSLSVTSNGTYTAPTGIAYTPVSVAVQPVLQSKTVSPSESQQTVTPDSGKDGLSSVTVNAVSSSYVGSGVTRRSSTDLSASGATVTAPSGYYAASASKSVSSMTLPTSTSASATSGYTSKATVSRSTSDQYINIGTGYNSAGGYYKINAVPDGSVSAKDSISESGASIFTYTGGIMLRKETVNNAPTLTAGYVSSVSSSTSTVALMASCNIQGAQTITPSTANQTIASGTYLTGTQTIAGDADLVSGNIKSGVSIFGVEGSYSGGGSKHTATISSTGNSSYCYVRHNNTTTYYTSGDTFLFEAGDTLYCYVKYSGGMGNTITLNGSTVAGGVGSTSASYTYTMLAKDIRIGLNYSGTASISITESVIPSTYVAAQTVTPNAAGRTVLATNRYFTGDITVSGDADLVAGNIKAGVEIFGVTGTYGGDDGAFKSVIERTAVTPTLPSNLTSVGDYAFARCTNLALTSLPSGVTSIGVYAFYGCANLALASLPSVVTSIDQYAFYNCTNLALTSLPSGVTYIGSYAFQNCTNLALTSLPSGIATIDYDTFVSCTNLALTSLPSSLEVIRDYAFQSCTNLALTSLPSGVTHIGSYAFQSCKNITITEIPVGVTTISGYAFSGCIKIPSITANGVISSFGNNVFTGRSGSADPIIQSAYFPNATASQIGTVFGHSTASYACRFLSIVDLGSTKSIAASAFNNCYALQTLVLRRSDAICTLANVSAFTNTPMRGYNSLTGTVYVPSSLISTYQTATNWSTLYGNGTVSFVAIEGSPYEL